MAYSTPRFLQGIVQTVHVRGGNSSDELVRYFPIGAKASTHVPRIELQLAAPEGTAGPVVVDLGMVEV